MKHAIVSDIHSNLQALEAVLNEIRQLGCDEILSLGDIVGYGGEPNECVELLIERSVISIKGNHDKAAAGTEEPWNFNPIAKEAALWTRENLTDRNKAHLAGLPDYRDYGTYVLVHGAVSDPDKYITGPYEAEPEFDLMGDRGICFFGHTHACALYARSDSEIRIIDVSKIPPDKKSLHIQLEKDTKYLINPGSVGQPRDRDPRASYLIYESTDTARDSTRTSVELRRAEYDIESAKKKIMAAGLNRALAERLTYGY